MTDSQALAELLWMLLSEPRTLVLLALLMAAALIDWRTWRIPNWLTLGGAVGALLLSLLAPASPHMGLGFALGGLAMGLVLMLPMYGLGVMGAGDVKLMAMVGAFLGASATLQAVLFVFVTGAFMAVLVVSWRRAWSPLLGHLKGIAWMLRLAPEAVVHPQGALAAMPSVGRLPYGVSIGLGTLSYLLAHQLGYA